MKQRLSVLVLVASLLGTWSCSTDAEAPGGPGVGGASGVTGTTGGLSACPPNQTNCSGACVDLLTNAGNCGACAQVCAGGTSCVSGVCACQTGFSDCAGVCTNTQSDSANCGGCGIGCAPGQTCSGGMCTCATGSACATACVDLTSDPANCGACGSACANSQQCLTGSCQCQNELESCTDGCVSTLSNPNNCGGCGAACPLEQVCSQGACAVDCALGETNCDRACVDIATDRLNCGACGTECSSDRACSAGACNCAAGRSDCNGTCVDTTTDASHCGGCGMACPAGQACGGGSCACQAGQQNCGTGCVDVASNPAHCGGCNMACTGGQQCTAGACACPAGQQLCGDSCVTTGTCNPTTGSGGSGGTTSTGNGGNGGSTTTGGDTDCTFTVDHEQSSAIGTVTIVNWSTDLQNLTSAEIHFSLASGGGTLVAPVVVEEGPEYRTLLLGMKGEEDYVFRIVVSAGGTTCTSSDYNVTTGPVANSVPVISRQVQNAAAVAPGFIVTSAGIGNQGGGAPAFILDHEGDVVWWASAPNQASRARMSWDGQTMWMMSLNVSNTGGEMRGVSMDGLEVQNNVSGLSSGHHDFTVLPNGSLVVILHQDGCSGIVERTEAGQINQIVANVNTIYQPTMDCHPNAIHYNPGDDTFTISDRNPNLFVKITRQGQTIWQFGGSNPVQGAIHFMGSWQVNHGHHTLDNGNFLFFNNGAGFGQGGGGSPVFEYQLNESSGQATQVWTYNGGVNSGTLGDVQRLPNGNTLITYSNGGVIHEVDQNGQLVQTINANSLGYAQHRPTLYGPPPR